MFCDLNRILRLIIIIPFFILNTGFSVSWRASDFFGDWMQWQFNYSPQLLDSMKDHLNSHFLLGFKAKYDKHQNELAPIVPFLAEFGQGLLTYDGCISDRINLKECQDKFGKVYEWLSTNPGDLLSFLKSDPLFTNEEINNEEQNLGINNVIDKYKSFAKLLFPCPDKHLRGEYLFSLADQLFKWCFSSEHWAEFKPYLQDPRNHPVARFVYSIIWNYLVGRGWKDWSTQVIDNIKQKTKEGARLVYVAGGTDILQLLKNEIYTIHIIDPFLTTQGRYYSDASWERWIKGSGKNNGRGDKVFFDFDGKKILMVRNDFKKTGEFQATLSTGESVKLDSSITDWNVINVNGRVIGKVTFDRRFATQKDFAESKNKVILMSFNEMYYAFQPSVNGGWGMDLSKLSDKFNIHVKQLTFPVNKGYLNAINESEKIKFEFIRLGSCST